MKETEQILGHRGNRLRRFGGHPCAACRPVPVGSRALVRKGSPRDNLAGLRGRTGRGRSAAIRPPSTAPWRASDALFHVAADYRLWAPDPEEIVRNNLNGTRNVMEAALRHGVERIVYTSSVATLAPRPDGALGRREPAC